MLVQSDSKLALTFCEMCPSTAIEDVSNVLLACFASRHKSMILLKAVIEKEVENTGNR